MIWAALAALPPARAYAQADFGSPRASTTADPQNTAAPVPPVQYRSALAGYRAFAEEDIRSWSETNQTVERIGGWRAYAREARQPAQEGAATSKQHGHAGHGMK